MRTIWGYLKNRSAVATYAMLIVALLGMRLLLSSSTARAGHPPEDTRMALSAEEPSSLLILPVLQLEIRAGTPLGINPLLDSLRPGFTGLKEPPDRNYWDY